ncbi:MAG: hypothetical protein ACK4NF_02185 [Planctomycetota bacterium]
MNSIRTIAIMAIIATITGMVSFKLGKMNTEKEITKIKETLTISEEDNKNMDIKTIVKEIEKLREKVIAKEKEYKKLKEEYNALVKTLESRENFLQELTNEFIKQGLLKGFAAEKKTEQKSAETPEQIIEELDNAIAEGDLEKTIKLWGQLLEFGPNYFPKAVEIGERIDKDLMTKLFVTSKRVEGGGVRVNLPLANPNKLLQQSFHYLSKIMELTTSPNYAKFAEWIIETKRDIKSSMETQALKLLPYMKREKSPELYSYIKEKLMQNLAEEEKEKYTGFIASVAGESSVQENMYKDLTEYSINPSIKKGIARGLGNYISNPVIPQEVKKDIKEKFDKIIENNPLKEELEKEFNKGQEHTRILGEDGSPDGITIHLDLGSKKQEEGEKK